MVAPLIDPARPHLSHQLHAATTRRRNDRQAITPVHQAGESGNGADTPPQSPHPLNRHNISPPNEHPPHGVGVQDPPAATRSASGRSRTPPPYRRATKPSGEHRNEDQRVATSGLDRPHSFRNDLSRLRESAFAPLASLGHNRGSARAFGAAASRRPGSSRERSSRGGRIRGSRSRPSDQRR